MCDFAFSGSVDANNAFLNDSLSNSNVADTMSHAQRIYGARKSSISFASVVNRVYGNPVESKSCQTNPAAAIDACSKPLNTKSGRETYVMTSLDKIENKAAAHAAKNATENAMHVCQDHAPNTIYQNALQSMQNNVEVVPVSQCSKLKHQETSLRRSRPIDMTREPGFMSICPQKIAHDNVDLHLLANSQRALQQAKLAAKEHKLDSEIARLEALLANQKLAVISMQQKNNHSSRDQVAAAASLPKKISSKTGATSTDKRNAQAVEQKVAIDKSVAPYASSVIEINTKQVQTFLFVLLLNAALWLIGLLFVLYTVYRYLTKFLKDGKSDQQSIFSATSNQTETGTSTNSMTK